MLMIDWRSDILLKFDINIYDVLHFLHIVHQFFWTSFRLCFLPTFNFLWIFDILWKFSLSFFRDWSFFKRYFFLWIGVIHRRTWLLYFDKSFSQNFQILCLFLEFKIVFIRVTRWRWLSENIGLILLFALFSASTKLRNRIRKEIFRYKFGIEVKTDVFRENKSSRGAFSRRLRTHLL